MTDQPPTPPSADQAAAGRLLKLVEGLELDSADGRAGMKAILREIEAACPGAIEQMSAALQLRRLGWTPPTAY